MGLFLQSKNHFPCPVVLGKNLPSFGLHRYKQGLRFVPVDDEGFKLRGDRQHLLYKGRKKSHRFTILGDKSFEYDCILKSEPESNIISLRMEGAENFDFLRQPDFVKEPFLKGSYAVYKKETLVGEGTGKLCHIHRPEVIDARGRRCWGALAVADNELRITIPEWWLSEARYPVVVDPLIGTTVVGSQYLYLYNLDDVEQYGEDEIWYQVLFEYCIPVNRFLVPDTINGICTAFMYVNDDSFGEGGGKPVLYSDNNNYPLTRKSKNENFADFTVNRNKPVGWRSSTFQSNGAINSGSYIWFGVYTDFCWETRFDYGVICYENDWIDLNIGNTIPNTYPYFDDYSDYKLSMYFTYGPAQNYIRTITQGVSLSEIKRLTGNYKRRMPETVGINSLPERIGTYLRQVFINVHINQVFSHWGAFIRDLSINAGSSAEAKHIANYYRVNKDTVQAFGIGLRSLFVFVRIVSKIIFRDYIFRWFLRAKEDYILKSIICREIILDSRC